MKSVQCGISNWNDKPLSLHLDHVNGRRTDNRLNNLRLYAQTVIHKQKLIAGVIRANLAINSSTTRPYISIHLLGRQHPRTIG
jgi:hypothetical protein